MLQPFEIAIVAGDGVLFIGVRVPEGASQFDIETVRTTLIEAFSWVEHVDEKVMQSLLFDAGDTPALDEALRFVVRREYSDPQYPEKIDCALQRLTSASPTLH